MTESLSLLILTILVIVGLVHSAAYLWELLDDVIGYFADPVELTQLARIADTMELDR